MKYSFIALIFCFIEATGLSAEQDPSPFQKDYIFFELARNQPLFSMKDRYLSGGFQPVLGYRHKVDDSWMMGLGLQFKSFDRFPDSEETTKSSTLDILTIYHESLYNIRIYHPLYLLVGTKILYLTPSQGAHIPIIKDRIEQVEIGAGVTASLVQVLSEKASWSVRCDLWRGTKTSRLEGLEMAVGLGWAI